MPATRPSTEIINWIEGKTDYFSGLRVPEGLLVGEPVRLRPWQKREIRKIYDNPHGTRRAILSFARKNGKTALVAMLLLVHLCGPRAIRNTQLYSAAQSREQAGVTYGLAEKMVLLTPELKAWVTPVSGEKRLYCSDLGTVYRALSADATTAFGLSPVFAVHDELGQVRGPEFPLYDAVESGMSAHAAPLSVICSTQASTDNDLLSILIDDALEGHDPKTVVSLYTAPIEADPFKVSTIKKANPAFNDFQNGAEIIDLAAAAKRMPSKEASYRNLNLNQRVESNAPLIPKSVWDLNAGEPAAWGPCYGGLDLSEVNDLTAFELVSPIDGLYGIKSKFWLPGYELAERSRADRVPYDVWKKQGHLDTTPGRSIEYEYVATEIKAAFDKYDLRKVAFDRYNMRHLRPWLKKAGLTESFIDERFVEFGQGFVSMSPAIRTMESLLLNGLMRHGDHPVLNMCAANAIATSDPAGNRKLDKKRATGRIDGFVAATMATSLAYSEMGDAVLPVDDMSQILEKVS